MYADLIKTMKNIPAAYETTEIAFWDDEHISKSMLHNHLAPESDGASRNHSFIQKSVEWISLLPEPGGRLLDLGCGPGIYAELLHDKGYCVTGIDFSKRSIEYAENSANHTKKDIHYIYQDYLTIQYQNEFDLSMMVYCDFGVLSPYIRKLLLDKVYDAIKPGGFFVLDVFTIRQYDDFKDTMTVTFENAGFWRPVPYLCIKRDKRYDGNIYLEQYTILTENEHQTYNLWNHAFTQSELTDVLHAAGFIDVGFYADVAGSPLEQGNKTICAVCKKPYQILTLLRLL